MRKINKTGLELIKKYEGFSNHIYLCPAGFPTIGYGHLCKETDFYIKEKNLAISEVKFILQKHNFETEKLKDTTKITLFEAENFLAQDIECVERSVIKLISCPLTDNQFSALVSFTFNLGVGALQRSTLRSKLNRGEYELAASEFARWIYADGKKLKGLVNRRLDEKTLFSLKY